MTLTTHPSASTVEISWSALMRLVELADRAGQTILACGHRGHETKADGSPVTPADRAAQAVICAELSAWDPAVPIIAEEGTLADLAARRSWPRYWLVDPLDGTKEFLAGRPDYTVNIALIEQGIPVLGVVGAPALGLLYWAGRGLGSWRREGEQPPIRLQVRPPADSEAGLRIVESRSHPSPALEDYLRQIRVRERLQVGSSLKFCWLADGRADCYPRLGPTMAWDVAAGDCVFRYAAPDLEPHASPLTYDAGDLRQPPFVIGFPPVQDGPDRDETAAAPLNRETPLELLDSDSGSTSGSSTSGGLTPLDACFVRSHFAVPRLDAASFRLAVGGLVERPLDLRLDDLHRMPACTRVLTLECAGNGRRHLVPAVQGEPWSYGAVSTAEWTGVSLAHVLAQAGPRSGACAVLFRGADEGRPADGHDVTRFARSLRLEADEIGEAMLAYAMNGHPLPAAHGAPLRLVVPGWYGMAWVKWLTQIELVAEPLAGFFETQRYWYEFESGAAGMASREPVTRQAVRALILAPAAGAVLPRQGIAVRGVAWSGIDPVVRVDVAIGAGPWHEARLAPAARQGGWQPWSITLDVEVGGALLIRARATDRAGRTQPVRGRWNRYGYGNNEIHAVSVRLT